MLRNQNELPKLPIPNLEDTLSGYLEWIHPLLSERELEESRKRTALFTGVNGSGEKLHNKLVEIDSTLEGSWLKPYWDEMYLAYREPLVPNMNYYAYLETDVLNEKYTLEGMVGKALHEITKLYFQVATEVFEPEMAKGQPLCMEQYVNIFKAVRLPKKGEDIYMTYDFQADDTYVIVYHKNNMYKVHMTDKNGQILNSDSITMSIRKILEMDLEDRNNNIGAMTTANRERAAEVYELISGSEINRESLDLINKALIVVCIDEESNKTSRTMRQLLLSDGKNRYFDKCGQLIVNKNGEMAFNNEHTGADGTTWFTIIDAMHKTLLNSEGDKERTEFFESYDTIENKEVQWDLSEEMKETLDQLQREHVETSDNVHVDGLYFNLFGKDTIKSLGMSPDAFFHIALQLAQYRTFGELRSTYEPVAVRYFRQGRTDCARAVNDSVLAFVKAVVDDHADTATQFQLLSDASVAHLRRIARCQKGLGVERHIYGLKKVYELYGKELGIDEIPAFFSDPGLLKLRHDFISTSGLGSEAVKFFGFGPVVQDGFGIGYGVRRNCITVSLSCKKVNKEQAGMFIGNISWALEYLKRLMEEQN